MNKTVNIFLTEGNKLMPDMHFKHPILTYTEFKQTGDSRYIYRNELDKAYFQHDMAYVNFKDLSKRTVSDKAFHHKAFNIAKNSKHNGYERGLASIVYKVLIKNRFTTCR